MTGVIIGVESTAHTFSFGLVTEEGIPRKSYSALYRPEEGGIHPREATDHHSNLASQLIARLLEEEKLESNDVDRKSTRLNSSHQISRMPSSA